MPEGKPTERLKQAVSEGAGGVCEYCRSRRDYWNDDFTLVIGLTPTGRATVEALQMNRPGVVNLRRLLHAAGLHPPEEPEFPHPAPTAASHD